MFSKEDSINELNCSVESILKFLYNEEIMPLYEVLKRDDIEKSILNIRQNIFDAIHDKEVDISEQEKSFINEVSERLINFLVLKNHNESIRAFMLELSNLLYNWSRLEGINRPELQQNILVLNQMINVFDSFDKLILTSKVLLEYATKLQKDNSYVPLVSQHYLDQIKKGL